MVLYKSSFLQLCIFSGHFTILCLDHLPKLVGREEAKLAKHSDTSWKQDHPSTLSSNSVQKAERMLKIAKSHQEEMAVEHIFDQISHAENAILNAENYGEHLDIVQQNKEQLELIKQQLHDVQKKEER